MRLRASASSSTTIARMVSIGVTKIAKENDFRHHFHQVPRRAAVRSVMEGNALLRNACGLTDRSLSADADAGLGREPQIGTEHTVSVGRLKLRVVFVDCP